MPSSPKARREHYLANREELLAKAKESREGHREELRAYARNYYAENKTVLDEKQAERYRLWRLENPKLSVKTHCVNGHPRIPENLKGNRSCRLCEAARHKGEKAKASAHALRVKKSLLRPPKLMKTHCKNGHPRTPENLHSKGGCKVCLKVRGKARSEATKARKLEKAKVWIDSRTGNYVSQSRKLDLRAHGWTQQMVEQTSAEQGNRCMICRKTSTHKGHQMHAGGLVADHAHTKPPQPRALLCSGCNSLIGFAKDSPDLCRAAAQYLEDWA